MIRARSIAIATIAAISVAGCSGAGSGGAYGGGGGAPTATTAPTSAPSASASGGYSRGGGYSSGGTKGDYATESPGSGGSVASAAPGTVQLSGYAFVPGTLTVAAGTTVTFTNADSVTHTVTEGQDGTPVASPMANAGLSRGGSTTVAFASAGTFHFTCTVHHSMNLTVTVTP